MKNILLSAAFLCILAVQVRSLELPLLARLVRAAGPAKKPDCRYDKGAWEECDAEGVQKRVMKLRPGQTSSSECEAEKVMTRPCKKACRYSKGTWSECENGIRMRKDALKTPAAGCESERTVSRKCKTVCRYSRSDWGPCESMIKTKTLTLAEGNASDCEATKKITKQCPATTTGKPSSSGARAKNGSSSSSGDKPQRNSNSRSSKSS